MYSNKKFSRQLSDWHGTAVLITIKLLKGWEHFACGLEFLKEFKATCKKSCESELKQQKAIEKAKRNLLFQSNASLLWNKRFLLIPVRTKDLKDTPPRKTWFFAYVFFSKTKHKPTKKNAEQCFSINLKATCENSGTFDEKKISSKFST